MSAVTCAPASGNPVTDNLALWSSVYVKKATTGRGSNSKISPYGIQKLRELILELAVHGKLVPQDSNDELVSVLLGKIAKEKERMIEEEKTKKQKQLPDVGDNLPHDLPNNWNWTRLGEVTNYGVTEKAEPGDVDGETWVLELEDVEKITSNLLKRVRYSERLFRSSKNRFNAGDVLYGKLRPYLDKVLVADEPGICTTEIIPVRGYTGIVPTFLRILLKAPNFTIYANESTHGMNLPRLGTEKARLALIPLAPTDEQHRIVAKVDELMALCDQLEQQQTDSIATHQTLVETLLGALTTAGDQKDFEQTWQRIAEHFDTLFTTEHSIDQLKQTILQLAVMGKLVPQDPNDEPTSVQLKKISEEKVRFVNAGKIKIPKPVPKITEDEITFKIPASWNWVCLSDILAIVTDGDHQAPPKSDIGIPFLVIGNLNTGRIIFDACKYVPENYYSGLDWIKKPVYGDLLYTVTGSFGIPIPVETEEIFCVQRHVAILKAVNSTPMKYLVHLLRSRYAFNYATRIATGIAQKTIPLTGLRRLPIPLPPLAEQHRIVAKVDELMALCDDLKTRLQDAQTTQTQLADAIVKQAVA